MIADDGFAGAGGWDLAAQALGITARGIENMPQARATRDAAGLVTIHDDVWTFRPDGKAVGKIDSPPCQTFSPAGKGSGRKAFEDVLRGIRDNYYTDIDHLRFLGLEVGDDRTALVLTPLHFATQYDYEWLAWEQVPTVLPVWEACAEVLRGQGWNVWTGLLYAEQYGVPQTRKRAFLLASRRHVVTPPMPTHSRYYSRTPDRLDPGVLKWVSMAEALGWGLQERPAPTITGGVGTRNGKHTGGSEPIAHFVERWASRPDWTPRVMAQAGTSCQLVDPRPITHPAATITGAGTAEWGRRATRAIRPDDRDPEGIRLEPHESGILQGFPAAHPWRGSKTFQYLQAGNAVPPSLALHALAAATGLPVEMEEVA